MIVTQNIERDLKIAQKYRAQWKTSIHFSWYIILLTMSMHTYIIFSNKYKCENDWHREKLKSDYVIHIYWDWVECQIAWKLLWRSFNECMANERTSILRLFDIFSIYIPYLVRSPSKVRNFLYHYLCVLFMCLCVRYVTWTVVMCAHWVCYMSF